MKNFKKSLLVVPALGVLMLAAAGSVGGTVAWFSSANTFNTDVSSFAVGRLNGDLSCTMTEGIGTKKQGDVIVVGKVNAGDATLTHASYDHAAEDNVAVTTITNQAIEITGTYESTHVGTVTVNREKFLTNTKQRAGAYTFTYASNTSKWTPSGAASGDVIETTALRDEWGLNLSEAPADGNTVIATLTNTYGIGESSTNAGDWMYSTTQTGTPSVYWYYAVSWRMTFSYSFGSDTTARNIYLDTTSAIATKQQLKAGTGSLVANKGFRIAFKATSRTVIWAPEQNTPADIRYIRTPAPYTEASYADGENLGLVYSGIATTNDNAGATLGNGATQGKQGTGSINKNYIGQLTSGAGSSIDVTCVAWFEGTDPNIVNSAELNSVAASLKFFAVPHQAA